ncbi:hypothetical protein [Corynebacterium nasicanis]|uniref:ESX-1 secretion-associated protein n=1 Tax=Corynebacterium nasicanis TaxID=1448267 RepID=A0ABW1QFW0_9CORY
MPGIHIDHTQALTALARMRADAEEQHHRHAGSRPAFAAAAAGRGFLDRGAAIAAMLEQVHAAGARRIDALRGTTEAAAAQVRVFRDVDKQLGGELA